MPRKGANHDSDADEETSGRKQSGKKTVKLRKVDFVANSRDNASCDFCWRRKLKCDGETPCENCQIRKITCTHSPRKLRAKTEEEEQQQASAAAA
eukprot:14731-Heterococcus_DN1.PRE.1